MALTHLVDTSVIKRLPRPEVRAAVSPLDTGARCLSRPLRPRPAGAQPPPRTSSPRPLQGVVMPTTVVYW